MDVLVIGWFVDFCQRLKRPPRQIYTDNPWFERRLFRIRPSGFEDRPDVLKKYHAKKELKFTVIKDPPRDQVESEEDAG